MPATDRCRVISMKHIAFADRIVNTRIKLPKNATPSPTIAECYNLIKDYSVAMVMDGEKTLMIRNPQHYATSLRKLVAETAQRNYEKATNFFLEKKRNLRVTNPDEITLLDAIDDKDKAFESTVINGDAIIRREKNPSVAKKIVIKPVYQDPSFYRFGNRVYWNDTTIAETIALALIYGFFVWMIIFYQSPLF